MRLTNGVASFYGCSINVASASYYQLQATSSAAYTATTSAAFYISGAAADHLVFYTQPGGGAAGAAWTQQPVVEAYTSSNVVDTTDSTSYVYLSIVTNPANGLLTCYQQHDACA